MKGNPQNQKLNKEITKYQTKKFIPDPVVIWGMEEESPGAQNSDCRVSIPS